jgi:hypothetical protein
MGQKIYHWRSATADDIGRVARFYDVDGDVEMDCHSFGILDAVEKYDGREVYLCDSPDFGSNPYNVCEVQAEEASE